MRDNVSLSSIVFGMIVKYFGDLTRSNTGLERIVIQGREWKDLVGVADHQPDGQTRYELVWLGTSLPTAGNIKCSSLLQMANTGSQNPRRGSLVLLDGSLGSRLFRQEENHEEKED